ncbi:MAG: hypothetical protein ACXVC1_06085 [Tumebacillaceae bacterium]
MRGSEIKIKRRDVMSPQSVMNLLRKMADQIETEHTFSLDGLPIVLGNLLAVRQEYKKEGREHSFVLRLAWQEELADQAKLDDEPEAESVDDVTASLPDGSVPQPPLEMPGFEHRARTQNS